MALPLTASGIGHRAAPVTALYKAGPVAVPTDGPRARTEKRPGPGKLRPVPWGRRPSARPVSGAGVVGAGPGEGVVVPRAAGAPGAAPRDTEVVESGHGDGVGINTSGSGPIPVGAGLRPGRAHPLGREAAVIGEAVADHPGMAGARAGPGGTLGVDTPTGNGFRGSADRAVRPSLLTSRDGRGPDGCPRSPSAVGTLGAGLRHFSAHAFRPTMMLVTASGARGSPLHRSCAGSREEPPR